MAENQNSERKPLFIEDSVVVVPIREAAQRAFRAWFATKADELADVLAPWGLDPNTNIAMPTLERLVLVGDERWVGGIGRGPDDRNFELTDSELEAFRTSAGGAHDE